MSSFSRETEFTKFVNEEIATARSRHTSRRRRIPMPSSLRRLARCNRREARAGFVALTWCCLVSLSTGGLGLPGEIISLPACTQRSIRRGAASASRQDPLAFLQARPQQSTVCHCARQNIHLRSRTSRFFVRPGELGLRTSHFRVDWKRYHLRSHQLPRSRCKCTAARLASCMRGSRFLQS